MARIPRWMVLFSLLALPYFWYQWTLQKMSYLIMLTLFIGLALVAFVRRTKKHLRLRILEEAIKEG